MRNRLIVVAIALCVLFGGAAACAPAASAATITIALYPGEPVCRATTSWWGFSIFWGLTGWNCRAW